MERGVSGKPSVSVGMAAVNLIGRIFGRGNRRRPRHKSGKLGNPDGYSRLRNRRFLASPGCVVNLESSCCVAVEDDDVTMLQQPRRRSSFSSDDEFSKRWTSKDHWCHRRRKGFYCMRLRIVNVARLVAMMRKVRLAYRRMMNAAAASKTMLSLADLYNDISDLIPAPCGNDGARTIVVIRPIKCAPGPTPAEEEDLPGATSGHGCSTRPSATIPRYAARRRDADHDAMSVEGSVDVLADHFPMSRWRKFTFRSLSCVCAPSMTSWTSLQNQDRS